MPHTRQEKWPEDQQPSDGMGEGTGEPIGPTDPADRTADLTRLSSADRRRFLKAAVVASAAVAAAGAASAVALTLPRQPLAPVRLVGAAMSGGPPPLTVTACFVPNAPFIPEGTFTFDATCSTCSDPSATLTYDWSCLSAANLCVPAGPTSNTSPYAEFTLTYNQFATSASMELVVTATRGSESVSDEYILSFTIIPDDQSGP